jgi:homoserine dehydrogenase
MDEKGRRFDEVLAEAQQLGYAEADPTFDVEGIDAAHKLAILSAIAFGMPLEVDRIFTEGVTGLSLQDVNFAKELGYRVRHLGIARKTDGGVELRVHPTLIPASQLIANVSGVMNAVLVKGDAVGPTLYCGSGAGSEPTASAVIADIVDIGRDMNLTVDHRVPYMGQAASSVQSLPVLPIDEIVSEYYVRITARDKAGVLSTISRLLSDAGISIEALIQKEPRSGEVTVSLVLLTNRVQESKLRSAIREIEATEVVEGTAVVIRVETLDE